MTTEQKIKEAFEAWLSSELEKMGADEDMRAAIQRDSKYGLAKFRAGYLALLNSLELEQCRMDAERYAWLRAEHDRIDPLGRVCWKRYDNRNGSEWCEVVDLDAAIDKAMENATCK